MAPLDILTFFMHSEIQYTLTYSIPNRVNVFGRTILPVSVKLPQWPVLVLIPISMPWPRPYFCSLSRLPPLRPIVFFTIGCSKNADAIITTPLSHIEDPITSNAFALKSKPMKQRGSIRSSKGHPLWHLHGCGPGTRTRRGGKNCTSSRIRQSVGLSITLTR